MKILNKNIRPFFTVLTLPILLLFFFIFEKEINNNILTEVDSAILLEDQDILQGTENESLMCIINLPNDTIICPGSSLIIDASAGFISYVWSTTETSQSITVPAQASGSQTYSVTVTCADLTMGTDAITITWLNQAPVITCEDVSVELNDNCEAGPFAMITSLSDDCSFGLAPTFDPPGPFTVVGEYLVTATVSDPAGNSSSCMSTITVVDEIPDATAPVVLSCPSDTILLVSANNLPFSVGGITPVFSDGCGVVNFTDPSNNTYPYGDTEVMVIGIDEAGNESLPCIFTVTIDTTEVYNDTQDGSVTIIPENQCTSFDGDLAVASPSFPQPPACSSGGGTRKDVWYLFEAPTTPVTIKVAPSPTMKAGMDVYSSNQSLIGCKAANDPGALDSLVLTPGVTPGVTAGQLYYVRVYDVDQNAGATTYFTIYIYVEDCPIPVLIPQQGFHQATSEFTDVEGWTHYIKQDSLLLFSIKREGRNIGNVGVGSFDVSLQRDAAVYDVSAAPYATAPNTQYLASGYYWKVTPNYASGLGQGQEFSIRSYYTEGEYEAMRDSCPDLGMDGHELLTHYKIDGINNPDPSALHASINSDMIHFFDSGDPPGGYTFSPFVSSSTTSNYVIEMCIIDFSGGGFMVRKETTGVDSPKLRWSAITIFPIPTYDNLNLMFTAQSGGSGTLEIYDVMGKQLDIIPINYSAGENKKIVTIDYLLTGVYFLKLIDQNGLYTTLRFIKNTKRQ